MERENIDEPFVVRERGSGTRDVVAAALRERGIQQHVSMELGSTEAIKQAVSAGLGLAIVSTATIASVLALGRLIVLDVSGFPLRRTLTRLTIHGRPQSRALAAFPELSDLTHEF